MKNVLEFNQAPQESQQIVPDENVTPLVAIGGLMTVKRLAPWYKPLLETDTTSDLEPEERFIPPPRRGIASPDVIRAELTDNLQEMYEKLGNKKMFLVGHSLGGLLATAAAIEQPDMISGVVSLGGVHAGIKENAANGLLRKMLGDPDEAKHILHDSPDIQEHTEKMAAEWPEDVPFHVVSTPLDLLIVPPHGYGVELKNGQQPEERLLVSPLPGVEASIRRLRRIPAAVQALRTTRLTEHLYLPRDPAVINYIDVSRRAAAQADGSLPNPGNAGLQAIAV